MISVPPDFKKQIFSVSKISSIIKDVLSSELFQNIQIKGEISSKNIKNGNVYLTLIETGEKHEIKASIKVNIFEWYEKNIKVDYKVGDEVVIIGDLNYYSPFGQVSLLGKNLYQYGQGLKLIKLEQLKEKLKSKGYFDASRKKQLPKSIKKIGIVTSSSGAAYQDILNVLKRKVPVSTVCFSCLVQGNLAPASIVKALDKAYKSDVDIIILARGGGDKNDLDCFNDEMVADKLYQANKFVITGIGHEIDTSICDYIADVSQITPTAAANYVLPDLEDVLSANKEYERQLNNLCLQIIGDKYIYINSLNNKLLNLSPIKKINTKQTDLYKLTTKLDNLINEYINDSKREILNKNNNLGRYLSNQINNKKDQLNTLEKKLEINNPLLSLKEGYALIKANNKLISSINQINVNDEIEIGFKDGLASARIERKESYGK